MSLFDEISSLNLPLHEKMEIYARQFLTAKPEVAQAHAEVVERLVRADAGSHALTPGDTAPAFVLPDETGRLHRLDDLLQRGPLVASFNRGHWCSYCRLELLSLNSELPNIRVRGGSVVSIMPDLPAQTRPLAERFRLDFPILTDLDNGYALQMGLLVSLGPAVSELMRRAGHDLAGSRGNAGWFVPIPATYVIAPDRRIVAAHVDADFRRRMPISAIRSALDSLG